MEVSEISVIYIYIYIYIERERAREREREREITYFPFNKKSTTKKFIFFWAQVLTSTFLL